MIEMNNEKKTFISSSTIFEGNPSVIVCDGDMEFKGQIKGDIQTSGTLNLMGKVNGNIEAESITIAEGINFTGVINCKNDLYIEKNSVVVGDINARKAEICSTVHGNLDVNGELVLTATASVLGNISTEILSVEPGANLQGNVSIKKFEKEKAATLKTKVIR